jgi:dimethylhistidine N-methyltransferase
VLQGLLRPDKHLPCKYFYDAEGSRLFERICELPEYYLTRTELAIMADAAPAIAGALGPKVRLVEFGSGSSRKTRLLLDHLQQPTAYLPIDLAEDALAAAVASLRAQYAALPIEPLLRDYTEPVPLPPAPAGTACTVCYFPGSTIGNFTADETVVFLRRVAAIVGNGGRLLLGADLQKDLQVLLPAYNDAAGVTAAFNLNLLKRINRELGGDFDLRGFAHYAFYNAPLGRIEMHLVSLREQTVDVGDHRFGFAAGESIHTENSYKYSIAEFQALAAQAGWRPARAWTDRRGLFALHALTAV